MCEIHGSFGRGSSDKGWLNGDHEGDKVLVLSVFDSGSDRFSSRARIKFYESDGPQSAPEIPVQLLRPVHPDKIGQDVVMLTGDYQCDEGKVRSIENGGTCVVQLSGTLLMIEARQDKLVRLEAGSV